MYLEHGSCRDPMHQNMESTFAAFDKNEDGLLDIDEFTTFTEALFRDETCKPYEVEERKVREMFNIFDKDEDGYINREEFAFCWQNWVRTIVCPTSAFIIVDVQNDFIEGTLSIAKCPAKQNALEVLDPINNLLDTVHFDAIFYTLDWHPADHISFIENIDTRELHPSSPITASEAQVYDTVIFAGPPPIEQRLWPKHCIQDSWGSELHKDLKFVDSAVKIYKGTDPNIDSYSAFFDNNKTSATELHKELRSRNVTDVYVCGLAYDVCVRATALDALSLGYRTSLIHDCCRGVDIESIEKTREGIVENNGVVINSDQVDIMVQGRDRRPELGYKLALDLKIDD